MGSPYPLFAIGMLYVFTGTNEHSVREHAFLWVATAQKKEPHLTYVRLDGDEIDESAFELIIGSGALFVNRLLVLIDDPYATSVSALSREMLNAHLDELAHTNNAIVIIAPRRGNTNQKPLLEKAIKVYVFDKKTTGALERKFNSALVNALGERNPEKLWLEIVRAFRAGDTPEMIHGLLHWKARELIKRGSRMWTRAQARSLSINILSVLGNSRRTGSDLSLDIERYALSIRESV